MAAAHQEKKTLLSALSAVCRGEKDKIRQWYFYPSSATQCHFNFSNQLLSRAGINAVHIQ